MVERNSDFFNLSLFGVNPEVPWRVGILNPYFFFSMSTPTPSQELAVDAFGKRVAARLNHGLNEVHPDISERLRFAREQALSARRAAQPRAVPVQASTGPLSQVARLPQRMAAIAGGAGRSGAGKEPGRGGAALVVFALALALSFGAALVEVSRAADQAADDEIVEVDTHLLLDELPPQAYMDAGFVQYLRAKP